MEIYHYVHGKFVSPEEAKIAVFDLGLIRGYGVFDYVQLYKGRPFHLKEHLKRLEWSAAQIEIELPITFDALYELSLKLIEKNPPIDAGIRFLLTGGLTREDWLLPGSAANLMILFHPYTPFPQRYYTDGVRCISNKIIRFLPSVKSTNYYPAIYGMKRAQAVGFDDAIYVTQNNEILEGTTSNIFFFKNGKLITATKDIVHGVTRGVMLDLAKGKFPIEFRALHMEELAECEEAFLTSSIKDGVPLVQIDQIKIGRGIPGPKTEYMRKIFREYLENYLEKQSEFLIKSESINQ